ncbi:hypothetical protein STEG23_029242, partial [Scotinomys teguina]
MENLDIPIAKIKETCEAQCFHSTGLPISPPPPSEMVSPTIKMVLSTSISVTKLIPSKHTQRAFTQVILDSVKWTMNTEHPTSKNTEQRQFRTRTGLKVLACFLTSHDKDKMDARLDPQSHGEYSILEASGGRMTGTALGK